MAKLPAFQFYPADWLRDGGLRSCSPAARGLWMDLLCWMHDAPARGRLVKANGAEYTPAEIARMAGFTPGQAKRHLAELEAAGVLSRDDRGVVYSRRMVSDEENRRRSAENGKLGGNPNLAGRVPADSSGDRSDGNRGVIPWVNPPLNPGVDAQVVGVANLEPTPSASSSASSSASANTFAGETPAGAGKGKGKAKVERKPNPMFDAVAEITASEPASCGPHVGKIISLLADAVPPYTPDEVREFGRRFTELCPWAKKDGGRVRPTLGEVVKYIGGVRAPVLKPPSRAYDVLD